MQDRLSLNSLQQNLISANIANMNTPGYSAKEASFSSILRESMEDNTIPMAKTAGNHFEEGDLNAALRSPEIKSAGQVDLDWEMMKLSKNSIEYQYMVSLISKKFANLKNVIDTGGK
jgi:flagellar basal-body rod protein FlgB